MAVRVLICPDSFSGTMTAAEASQAMALGWAAARPDDVVVELAVSDGGTGFVSALHRSLGGDVKAAVVCDPLGREVMAQWLQVADTAYIESAAACGLHLLDVSERNPLFTSTFGVGQLVDGAITQAARRIIIGLGGSATNDAGAGFLAALGARATDASGRDVTYLLANGGAGLSDIAQLDLSSVVTRIADVQIEVATDVDNPLLGLRGATNTFAPQKGADTAGVMRLEGALEKFAAVLGKRTDGKTAALALGAGAAGGLGCALIHLGATRTSGIDRILELSGFTQAVREADLILTGEGSFDWQSLSGKAVTGIGRAAAVRGVPVVVLAGRVDVGRREWQSIGIHGVYSMSDMVDEQTSLMAPQSTLSECSERVARTWGR